MHTRLRLCLERLRTHQIRVHMAHITHPLVGDPVYGGRPCSPKALRRYDLHAAVTSTARRDMQPRRALSPDLRHRNGMDAPIPQDMVELIEVMRADFEEHKDEWTGYE